MRPNPPRLSVCSASALLGICHYCPKEGERVLLLWGDLCKVSIESLSLPLLKKYNILFLYYESYLFLTINPSGFQTHQYFNSYIPASHYKHSSPSSLYDIHTYFRYGLHSSTGVAVRFAPSHGKVSATDGVATPIENHFFLSASSSPTLESPLSKVNFGSNIRA